MVCFFFIEEILEVFEFFEDEEFGGKKKVGSKYFYFWIMGLFFYQNMNKILMENGGNLFNFLYFYQSKER